MTVGAHENGVIQENDSNWDCYGCTNLGFVNEGESDVRIGQWTIKPGETYPLTGSTALINRSLNIKFTSPGTKRLLYSTVRVDLSKCNNG